MSGQSLSQDGQDPLVHAVETAPRPLAGFARDYPAGYFSAPHAHPRAQLLHATSGVMRVETEAALFTVPPGYGLWLPARIAHTVRMDGVVAMRALFLRHDAARAGPDAPSVITVSPLLRELILAACAEPATWDQRGPAAHIAALAAWEIARAPRLRLALPAPRDPRLARAAAALHANPADPRTLEALAAEAGASSRTLARLFRRDTGMSFAAWRQTLRLAGAWGRLAAGDPPAQAAARVGYASLPAFGAAFRAAFGTTPARAAREARGGAEPAQAGEAVR